MTAKNSGWKKIKTLSVEETADVHARMGLDSEGLRRSRETPGQVSYSDGYAAFGRGESRDPIAAGVPYRHRRSWLNGWDDARDADV